MRRLREAGAVILGKTNCPEFAAGGNTFNEVFGRTRNPWNPERSAGGSTGGGAAALATGMIALAEGTDLGGSLRIPASFCGVVGLRPSSGWCRRADRLGVGHAAGDRADGAHRRGRRADAPGGRGAEPDGAARQPIAGRDFVGGGGRGDRRGLRVAYCPDPARHRHRRGRRARLPGGGVRARRRRRARSRRSSSTWRPARKAFLALRGLWFVTQHVLRA